MSAENVLRFVEMVRGAGNIQGRVDDLNGDLAGLVRLAAANDCDFSAQDWIETVSAMRVPGELSGEALDRVVGGVVATAASGLGDIATRFACFPPIGTALNIGGTRTLGS